MSESVKKYFSFTMSFLMPLIVLGFVFALSGVYPFGAKLIFPTDLGQQYYPFLSDYYRKLREGESLFWTWRNGGSDYVSLFAYYLASPLNLALVLFPAAFLKEAVELLILVKIGFAGLFMAVFLRRAYAAPYFYLPVFACFYAISSFTMQYYYNIVWLDTFALFPLVALGLFSFMREGKYMTYIISLAASAFANYYFVWFTCFFVAAAFFLRLFRVETRIQTVFA